MMSTGRNDERSELLGQPVRIISGIQPTAELHLGNYFGAIQAHVELQDAAGGPARAFFFIANLHALTTVHDAARLRRLTHQTAIDYLTLGIDPSKATLFRQSDVPEVCELAWLLACCIGKGVLERAHGYKDKVARGLPASMGLFSYPILMAADILVHRGTIVPAGQDQKQHVEMARRMAASFNAAFGREVLIEPAWRSAGAAVVPGLDGAKMSKSYQNTIPVFAPDTMTPVDVWSTYFATIVTDARRADEPKNPNDTVMTLFRLIDPAGAARLAPSYAAGKVGYAEAKRQLYAAYEARFAPLRERRRRIAADESYVERVLLEGAERAREVACTVMEEARDACGIAVSGGRSRSSCDDR